MKTFLFLLCFISGSLWAEKPGLAIVYQKEKSISQVEEPMMDLVFQEIKKPNSILNQFTYVLVDSSSEKNLSQKLQELKDKNHIKIFVGLSLSQTVEESLPFFRNNPDCIGISIGSSTLALEKTDNIYRLVLNDRKILEGFSYLLKPFQGKQILTFYQKGDLWAKNLQKDLKNYLSVQESVEIDPSQPSDIALVEKTLSKRPKDAVCFCFFTSGTKNFFEKTADIWIKNPRQLFGGDGSIHFPFTGKSAKAATLCHLICNQYFGFASPLVQKIGNPYSVNILDAIDLAYDFSIKKLPIPVIAKNKIGYAGYLDLNEFGDKKYGAELFYEFIGTRWKLSYIYDDGKIMRFFCPVEEKLISKELP